MTACPFFCFTRTQFHPKGGNFFILMYNRINTLLTFRALRLRQFLDKNLERLPEFAGKRLTSLFAPSF